MKAKRWKAGVSGILERAVAADPIGSDVTSGVLAQDLSDDWWRLARNEAGRGR